MVKSFSKLPYWVKSRDHGQVATDLLYNCTRTSSIILSTSTLPSDLEMPDTGTPPVIPIQFQQYKYVRKFARGLNEIVKLASQLLFNRPTMATQIHHHLANRTRFLCAPIPAPSHPVLSKWSGVLDTFWRLGRLHRTRLLRACTTHA